MTNERRVSSLRPGWVSMKRTSSDELVDELAQPGGQALGVVALAQDPRDLAGLHARRDEEQPAPIHPADAIGHVEGDVLDRPVVPEEVVERRVTRLTGQTEEDVDTRRLDVSVDHPDPEAACGDDRRQIRRGIRLPRPTPKGVDADDGRHPALRDQSRPVIEHTRSGTPTRGYGVARGVDRPDPGHPASRDESCGVGRSYGRPVPAEDFWCAA